MTALPPPDRAPSAPSFAEALRFWLWLGCVSFGGPAGQIAIMHSELVERRRWISEQRFLHALNYCMLLPGPEAQQLATYIGWLLHRTKGGIVAGALFVLPSLALLIGLSWLYVSFGQLPLVAALFGGVKSAVTALVVQALWRIGGRTLKSRWAWAIALGAFAAHVLLKIGFPWIVAAAALCGLALGRWRPQALALGGHGAKRAAAHAPTLIDDDTPTPPHARFRATRLAGMLATGALLWTLPMSLLWFGLGAQHLLTQMALFFTQAALLTFGGAYAVLPYVVQGAVLQHGWLSTAQMMDGLALGETTPGPLIMVVAFVGYLGAYLHPLAAGFAPEQAAWAGAAAAVLVTWFTFLPSFVFILAGGPLVEATKGDLQLGAPLAAISAAVVGVIASLALFFGAQLAWPEGLQGRFDLPHVLLAGAAALALLRFKRGVVEVIVVAGLCGLLLGH